MTDYEKDFNHWQNDNSLYSDFMPEPKRSDYDEYGYKPENVIYDGNLVLDKYLVDVYGIEYARKNPREVLKKVFIKKPIKNNVQTNMTHIVRQTWEERFKMYMRHTKKELAAMLAESAKYINPDGCAEFDKK